MTTQQIQIFTSADGEAELQVALDQESVWLIQAQMGDLFATTPENVLMHLQNMFKSEELDQEATTKEFLVVRQEGNRKVKRQPAKNYCPVGLARSQMLYP